MHIRPHTLALYFRAKVLRSLSAEVKLAHHCPERTLDALIRIRNREEAVGKAYVQGAMSPSAVIREANTLMSLRNALYQDVRASGARPMFHDVLGDIARFHIAPAIKAAALAGENPPRSPVTLAQARFGQSTA